MTDALENAVVDLKGKIAERVTLLKNDENWREIERLYMGLGVLEDLCKMTKTDLAALLGIATGGGPKIAQYEFAGLPPLEAAKKYLRKIAPNQKAASLDEIMAALETGSLKANRDDLRTSLSRSTVEIYKTGEDIYGLVENFPHIKQGSPGRKKITSNGLTGSQSGTGQTFETPVVPDSEIHKDDTP